MSAENWISPVKIEDSTLLGCEFSMNSELDYDTKSLAIQVSLNFDHQEIGQRMVCKSVLGVTLSCKSPEGDASGNEAIEEDASNAKPLRLGCKVGMILSIDKQCFEGGSDSEENEEYLEANAVSMGFGRARSFLEELSSQTPVGTLVLPAISPYDLLEAAKRDVE